MTIKVRAYCHGCCAVCNRWLFEKSVNAPHANKHYNNEHQHENTTDGKTYIKANPKVIHHSGVAPFVLLECAGCACLLRRIHDATVLCFALINRAISAGFLPLSAICNACVFASLGVVVAFAFGAVAFVALRCATGFCVACAGLRCTSAGVGCVSVALPCILSAAS